MHTLDDIRHFIAVVQTGSFTRAADTQNTSRSVISKRLSLLEEALGVRLLNRTTRRLSLTEAGEQFYRQCRDGLGQLDAAIDDVRSLNREPRGLLRVNLPVSFGILHVAPLIPEFRRRYPGIRVDLDFEDRKIDMIEPGFDVSIRIADLEDSTLVARPLARCRHRVVAAPAYLQRHPAPATPADLLQDHTIASYRHQDSALEWQFLDAGGHNQRVRLQADITANNSLALRDIVLGGAALARMPTFLVGPDLAAGRLVALLPHLETLDKRIHVVYPQREYLPAKSRAFIEFLGEKISDPPGWDAA